MLAVFTAGTLGGIIGAALVGFAMLLREGRLGRSRAGREAERVTALSYRLWRLYVDLASGAVIRPGGPRALYGEVLRARSGPGSHPDTEDALFAMTSLLFRASDRAGELRRVGLRVSIGQFADLTENMQRAFGLVQLEAAGGRVREGSRPGGSVTELSVARMRAASRVR